MKHRSSWKSGVCKKCGHKGNVLTKSEVCSKCAQQHALLDPEKNKPASYDEIPHHCSKYQGEKDYQGGIDLDK